MAPRQTSSAVAEPDDWQTVDPGDWQTVAPSSPPQAKGGTVPPEAAQDAFKAGVNAKVLNVTPGFAYQNRDEIDAQLRHQAEDYDDPDPRLDPTMLNDLKVGYEGSIFGLTNRKKLPEEIRNPGLIDRFMSGLSQMVADVPFMLAGGLAGGAAGSEVPVVGNVIGAGAGAFALPAAGREALVQGIKNGDVSSFSDILHRVAAVTWAGAKGAVVGGATAAAGGAPVGSVIGKSALASVGVRGLYQAATLTTAADLLEGKIPTKEDFAGNAALILPLELILHGTPMLRGETNQALLDVYAKDGKTPAESTETLHAQPTVKPDPPPGLRPAINAGDSTIEGNDGETHQQLAERSGSKPVTIEKLEADPSLADEVLQSPAVQSQDVIDRAYQMKKEAVEAGDVSDNVARGTSEDSEEKPLSIDDLYDRASLKSGRGFVTPDGKFLSRMEARKWMKDNEPDVHQMWESETGDKQAELHSEDYAAARNRVQARNVASGDPVIANLSPQNASRLAAHREGLNKIKAGDSSKGYGREVVRTLFVGQEDMRVAEATQLREALKKIIPDARDQEALTYFRDYKGNPERLQAAIERYEAGDNAEQKALNEARRRAQNPSPALLEADKRMTEYYTGTRDEARQYDIFESSIDPSRYVPHSLMRVDSEASGGGGAPFARNTPFGRERKYFTLDEAVDAGKQKLEARTVNALDTLSMYGDHHATAVATRIFSAEIRNSGLGRFGTPDHHPDNWVEFAPGERAFRNERIITDAETGEPSLNSQSLYTPKDIHDAMKPMFERGLAGTKFAGLLKSQSYVKALELGLSLFHVKALNITALNNMGLTGLTKAMFNEVDPIAEREWAADGLNTAFTSTPYEAYEGLKKSSIPTGLDKLANAPVVKQIDEAFKATTRYTFDVVQRSRKVADASLKIAAWMANHPEATNEELFAARRGIAKEVNSAYGGLNWDVLGTGKTVRDVSRLFLLAPDWTFSNVLTAKYAFEGGAAGPAARMFWARSFATGIAMTGAMSIAIGGRYDPTDVKHFDQVYLGKDKDGKEMYADWFFAGAPRDSITLAKRVMSTNPITGTAEFVVSKASPLLGTGFAVALNKQPTGKPVVNTKDSGPKQLGDAALFTAERVAPISGVSAVETVIAALKDPNHVYTYKDLLELAADSMGSQTIHYGSDAKKPSVAIGGKAAKATNRGGRSKFSIRSKQ